MIRKIGILSFLSITLCKLAFGQVTISDGTQMNVYSGTTIKLNNDTLYVNNSSLKNHGHLLLSQEGFIVEQAYFPIFGEGYEQITKKYDVALSSENSGGLGLLITSSQISDSIKIRRGHTDIYPNQSSIFRWYEISPMLTTSEFVFTYDDSELNGISPSSLTSYNYETSTSNWVNINGINSTNSFAVNTNAQIEKLILTDSQINGIQIFPNPGFNELIIANIPLYSKAQVKLFSVEGKLVRDKHITTTNYSYSYINIDGLAPGMYVVTVSLNNGNFYSKKWIKR